jgi:hypothetical protein
MKGDDKERVRFSSLSSNNSQIRVIDEFETRNQSEHGQKLFNARPDGNPNFSPPEWAVPEVNRKPNLGLGPSDEIVLTNIETPNKIWQNSLGNQIVNVDVGPKRFNSSSSENDLH